MSFGCPVCLALEFGSEDSLRALIVYQAEQLHRLTGGTYEEPTPDELVAYFAEDDEPEPAPRCDPTPAVESVLWADDIFRRPPRAAAPRLIERLADAGWVLTYEETTA